MIGFEQPFSKDKTYT